MPARRSANAHAGSAGKLILTTQPGWAFATLAELRSLGIGEYVELHHRDSTLVVSDTPVLRSGLTTPAEVFGAIATAGASRRHDATETLSAGLRVAAVKRQVLGWLPATRSRGLRRFSVTAEVYGPTGVHRKELSDAVADVVQQALPRWKRTPAEGLRILLKGDAQAAVLGVQLSTTLALGDAREPVDSLHDSLPGALRQHLACGLLTLAGAGSGTTEFDPFMGTATILAMAQQRFGVASGIGLEISPQAFRLATRRLADDRHTLVSASFDDFDPNSLPARSLLVSNVPFGVRFEQPPTDRLGRFLDACLQGGTRLTLLMSRDQAKAIGPALGLRVKNVLVLGQPASIVYHAASTV